MADREKVIEGLRCHWRMICSKCPYHQNATKESDEYCGRSDLFRDALELLKEQEPVKPTYDDESPYLRTAFHCGLCDKALLYHQPYCGNCGRKVKWDDHYYMP